MFEKLLNFLKGVGDSLNRPLLSSFFVYLILLWLLNIADIFQTLMLKRGGNLKTEINFFINYFLASDEWIFVLAKLSALLFITAMLLRGYYDRKGTNIGGTYYSPSNMQRAITFLVGAGVVYYLVIVLMPFAVLMIENFIYGT